MHIKGIIRIINTLYFDLNMSKFTFLLPAYKSAFLNEALRSIQEQTYTDFKVLISDDCSPENIHDISEPYLNDARFTYRRNESNMGSRSLVSHWNLLVSLCDTEYCIMAGDDDIYDPQFLERIDYLVTKYPELNLYRARACRINKEGVCFDVERTSDEFEKQLSFVDSLFFPYQIHCIGNYVFKTKNLVDKGSFMDFPLAWFSDDATVIRCSEKGVANTSETLFNFRKSTISISSTDINNKIYAKEKVSACCRFYDWMNSYPISHHSNLFDNNLFWRIKLDCHQRIYGLIMTYYHQLDVKSLWKLLKWMKKSGFEQSIIKRFMHLLIWLR